MSDRPPSIVGEFWRSLVEDGQVVIVTEDPPLAEEMAGLDLLLAELDRDTRLNLAFMPPVMDIATARWAFVLLFRACQFLMFRHIGPEVVEPELSLQAPGRLSPSVIYSADLALRHLGEVITLAHRLAPEDILTACLIRLAQQWPLSSVGIDNLFIPEAPLHPDEIGIILANPCLRTLYVDRIIACNDISRLENLRVARLVRTALGPFSELNPKLFHHLTEEFSHEG